MARPSPSAVLRELEHLAGDPEAQARYATTLLATERRALLVGPALAAVEQLPLPTLWAPTRPYFALPGPAKAAVTPRMR